MSGVQRRKAHARRRTDESIGSISEWMTIESIPDDALEGESDADTGRDASDIAAYLYALR